MTTAIIVVLLFLSVLKVIWTVSTYRRLDRLRAQVDASWQLMDAQLKRRQSLVPPLVAGVARYTGEHDEAVASTTAAHAAAVASGEHDPAGRAQAEAALTHALSRLLEQARMYPPLCADSAFAAAHGELENTDDKVSYARQFYNTAVSALNETVTSPPTNIVAMLFRFRSRPYFEAAGEQRSKVKLRH
jgi:LemA protein